MAKKATTIILFIVVLLLLGSTVYVSIILTSEDSPTTARDTRASEIDSDLSETDATDPFALDPTADPLLQDADMSDPLAEPSVDPLNDALDPAAETLTEDSTVDESTVTDPTQMESEGDELAYLNPSPVDNGLDTDTTTVEEDVFAEPTQTSSLPETGKGQSVPSTSPTFAPTMAASATPAKVEPTQTVSLPTAGFGIGIVTSVIAGVTILASLFL